MAIAKKMPKVAALGYYGFGNLGDEAVLAGIRTALTETLGETDFTVLTANEENTRNLHPNVRTVPRWKWRSVAQTLRGTDIFILGGGSLLQDATSAKSVLWYATMALLAQRLSKRVLWWGQGIGPLNTKSSRILVRLIGNQADAITVRDKKSAQLLKQIGVRGSIETVADPAFALPVPIYDSTMFTTHYTLAALRAWKSDTLSAILPGDRFARTITERLPGDLFAYPMHLPDDADFAAAYFANAEKIRMGSWDFRLPAQTLATFVEAQMVIAMRLHALIFAARCAVPFVALSYDPKVDALAIAAGQEDVLLPLNDDLPKHLPDMIEKVRDSSASRRLVLQDFAHRQNLSAKRPAQIAAELLRSQSIRL